MRSPRASAAACAPTATSDFPEPVGVERITFAAGDQLQQRLLLRRVEREPLLLEGPVGERLDQRVGVVGVGREAVGERHGRAHFNPSIASDRTSRSTGRVEVGSQCRSSSAPGCRARAGARSPEARNRPVSAVHAAVTVDAVSEDMSKPPGRAGARAGFRDALSGAGAARATGSGVAPPLAGSNSGMPELVPPMLAASGPLPDGSDWVVEFAWEGLRCLAHVRPDRLRLRTANGRDVTPSFPELAEPLTGRAPRGGMVLDGTVVAVGEGGLPRRRLLQRRTAAARPSPAVLRRTPVGFIVGDLLWLAGRDLTALPYRRRRELLDELGLARPPVVVSPTFPVAEAEAVMRTAEEYGAEALHARHLDAPYRPGRPPASLGAGPAAPVRARGRRRLDPGGPAAPRPCRRAAARCARSRRRHRAALRGTGRDRRGGGAAGRRSAPGPAAAPGLPVRRAAAARRRPRRAVGRHRAWPGAWSSPTGPRTGGCGSRRGGASRSTCRSTRRAGRPSRCCARPPSPCPRRARSGRARPCRARSGGRPGATSRCRARAKRVTRPAAPEPPSAAEPDAPAGPASDSAPDSGRTETRRLEQHFVYNALNTIAALMRTDPARARELLLGFADLYRAADQPDGTPGTLGRRAHRGAGVPAARAGPVRPAAAGGDRRRRGVARPADGAAPGARRGARGGAAAASSRARGAARVTVTAERAGAGCAGPGRRARRRRPRRRAAARRTG